MMRTTERPMAGPSRVLMLGSLLFLILALSTPVAGAQKTGEVADPHPLRPADISSPRDTLRSFLTNATQTVEDRRRDEQGIGDFRAYGRAMGTLDFRATPDSDSWMVRTQHLALLKEILDRIELPPDDQIPGDAEVADGAITQWTIPNTSMTIERMEDGPRAGEFLFSADTVQRLGRLYRHVKHLPYKPGATAGWYDEFVRSDRTAHSVQEGIRNRLKPVDTSNPRSTLEGFIDSVNGAYALVVGADSELRAEPPRMTRAEGREIEITAENLLQRAIATLDLSRVPAALREDVGVESALQLKEIFDRMLLPPLDSIPNAQMVEAARKRAREFSTTGPIRWRYPNTEIEIVEMTEGERQGQFLFSAATVNRIPEFYGEISDFPYREDGYDEIAHDYSSPDKSVGFYKFYASTPGYLLPYATSFGRLVDALPDWFKAEHGEQRLWQWVGLLLCVLAAALAGYVVHRIINRLAGRLRAPLNGWLSVLAPIIIATIVFAVIGFINDDLNLTGDLEAIVTSAGRGIVVVMAAWAAYRLCKTVAETIIALLRIQRESIDASLYRLSARLAGILFGAWIFIDGVHKLGVDIVPLLAGLSVGGLAFALAARPMLENIIGSFMIFADKPYRVGHRIRVMGQKGTVESIGLRSTSIRLRSGPLTSIPNEKMASVEIENIGLRPHIRRVFSINITYDTSPEKVNRAVEIVRDILAVPDSPDEETPGTTGGAPPAVTEGEAARHSHPNAAINQPDFPPRVFFSDFNADSLNILVMYWYHPPEKWNYLEHANWINIQIVERFNAEGIDFALPTQTLHLAGDEKRPLTVAQRWLSEDQEGRRFATKT